MNALSTISIGVDGQARHRLSANILTLTVIVLVVWLASATAFAQLPINSATGPGTQTFRSPNGYSLTYPSNWQLASSSQQDAVRRVAKGFASQAGMAARTNYDVVLYDPYSGAFRSNVNVLVQAGTLSIDDENAAKMKSTIQQVVSKVTTGSSTINVRTVKFSGHPALVGFYDMTLSGYPVSLMQVALPAGDKTLIITCTSLSSRFFIDKPSYDMMIDSVAASVPAPSSPFAGLSGIPPWLIGAVVGGVVGLVVWMIGLTSRARRDNQPAYGSTFQNPGQYQDPGQYQNSGQYQNPGQYQPPGQYPPQGQGYQNPQPPQENPGPPYP